MCLVSFTEDARFACKLAKKAMGKYINCDKSVVKYFDYKKETKMGINFKFNSQYQMTFDISNNNFFLYRNIFRTLEYYQNNITEMDIYYFMSFAHSTFQQ